MFPPSLLRTVTPRSAPVGGAVRPAVVDTPLWPVAATVVEATLRRIREL
jgi:hypothetical protein